MSIGRSLQIDDIYRLSPSQQGMLFHCLSTPETGMYFEQVVLGPQVTPDFELFGRVWQLLMDRNPILRTSFVWEEVREPVQVVHDSVPLELTVHDLSDLPAEEQEERVRAWAEEDRLRGFDLAKPPLLRWTLLPGSQGRGWAVLSYHHMLLDGWSAVSLIGEAGELYQALETGEPARPRERRPFREYLAWLRGQDLTEAEAYWRRTLKGFTAPTRLAFDRDPAADPGEHVRIDTMLGAEATTALQELARRHRLTLNTLLQGAWSLLLARFAGSDDVVFGVTVSGRPPALKGVETMLGCFINTLPTRVPVPSGERLARWLEKIQADQIEMRRFEHTPLVDLRKWSEVPSGVPIFESILVFENFDPSASRRTKSSPRIQRTNFPLVLMVEPVGGDLLLRLGWDRPRFAEEDVRRLQGSLVKLLAALPQSIDRQLGEIDLLEAAERERLLGTWSHSSDRYPQGRPVHRQIEEQAGRYPDRIAASLEDTHLSYGELLRRSRALARRLAAAGVGPEARVAVALERSPELVVSLLAIHLAGGAYLPLDLESPTERLALLLEDAWPEGGPRILVAEPATADRLPDLDFTCISPHEPAAPGAPEADPVAAELDNPAYVIYTSGSTGRPKGVVVSHRALANRLEWSRHHDVTAPAVFLQKTTTGFDVSVLEIFLPLVVGGRVEMARPGAQRDLAYLVDRLSRGRVTHVNFPPSVLPLVLAEPGLDACLDLEVLYTAGEAVPPDLPRRVAQRLAHLPGLAFRNRYGPTEATIGVLGWRCRPEADEHPVPIGRPLAGAEVYVLSPELGLVPAGVPGELCLGGPGLARGYLGRPGRTAEQFVPHPFTPRSGARLYRTGDLARFRADGAVEFLGRIDRQVKIRGFRIEPEEVELALARHPRVREAAVVDRVEAGSGLRYLAAYWVGEDGDGLPLPDAETLRAFLGGTLPSYMVPTAWVELDELPKTASFKVDRRALPEPEATGGFVEPRTEHERAVAELFGDVLDVEGVGAGDDFFALGGHSLHLVRLHNELRKRFAQVPGLAVVARNTQVSELARVLEQAEQGELAEGAGPSVDELRAAAVLAPEIAPAPGAAETAASWPSDGRPSLLTGATGFLGAHLLHELLEQTPGPVLCLVRAADDAAALERLRSALEAQGLWREARRERIVALAGDLSEPLFGLSEERFAELSHELGAIYHNGAMLDLLHSFWDLEATNVGGTREAIRLACLGRPKPLAHVSTLSVFDGDAYRFEGRPAHEDDPVDDPTGIGGGYAQSKWVGEHLVREAGSRGLPVTIYRPGVVAGSSETGITKNDGFGSRLFRGCIQLGLAPESWRGPTWVSPVDFVAQAIVWLSLQPELRGRTFHPLNPHTTTVESLLDTICTLGYPITRVPFADWRRALAEAVEAGADNALGPLLPLFPVRTDDEAGEPPGEEAPAPRIHHEYQRTVRALEGGPVAAPGPEEELLAAYLRAAIARGLLAEPSSAAAELEGVGGRVA